ncbi:DUF4064 domain-containing protein [Saccharomonospora sp. NPDC046836]|uniref:DUF4064 domain-containing protein n=1 Tax=Saccharomonospora sp. NPDC046836 TaxID=3156921 RepID=UPI0033FBDD4B
MSAPQPPNQPWGGGQQPPQGPAGGPQAQQDSPFGSSEPTQVVQPQHLGEQQFGDGPEPTQVVQPGQPGQADGPGAESTQLVPPGSQPPPAIPYAPPPSAADNPAAMSPQGGFGQPQQPAPFGQQPGGFGQPPQQPGGFGGPPPGQPGGFDPQAQGGFGGPPPGPFGAPPPGFGGVPAGGGGNPMFGWIAGGVAALVSLIGLLFAFIDMGDISEFADVMDSAPDSVDVDAILAEAGIASPGTLMFYIIFILIGAAVGLAGGVLLALAGRLGATVKKLAPIVLAAGGAVLLVFAILLISGTTVSDEMASQMGGQSLGTPTLYLIFGILVVAIGVLGLIPATKQYVGLGGGPSAPGGFGQPGGFGPPPGGFGPPSQPGGFAQPGQPGAFGQPGGPNPSSGGFPQPGQPGGFGQPGQPPQQPGGFGGPPPGQPGGFGQPGGYGQPGQPPQQW